MLLPMCMRYAVHCVEADLQQVWPWAVSLCDYLEQVRVRVGGGQSQLGEELRVHLAPERKVTPQLVTPLASD